MTIPAKKNPACVSQPFLVKYYGNSDTEDINTPIGTISTRDTFALCIPELYPWGLDIRYRMLKTRELARAQGFTDEHTIAADTKRQARKLIGNAIPVNMAHKLCKQLLEPTPKPTLNKFAENTPSDSNEPISGD